MKVLITGGAGYIGSVLTEVLLNKGYQVTVLDNLIYKQTSVAPFSYHPNFNFILGDVRDESLLKPLVESHDVIIPLAAIVGFPACKADPQLAWEINYNQIKNILDVIDDHHIILYPNTNSGYGVGEDGIYCTEESANQKVNNLSGHQFYFS